MSEISQTYPSQTVIEKWNFKYLFLILVSFPMIYLIINSDYRYGVLFSLIILYFYLGFDKPKVGLGLYLFILMLDFNPCTYRYDLDSFFTIIYRGQSYLPMNVFCQYGLITGWIFRVALANFKGLKFSRLHLPVLLFIVWFIVVYISTMVRTHSLTEGITSFKIINNFLLFFMIYQVLGTIEDYHQIFKVILAGLTIILCVGVYKLVNNQYTHWVNRYFILFYENIQVLNLLGIFMLFNGLDKKSIPLTFLGLVVYLLCAILIFLSGIRTMMVAAVGSLIATLLMRFRFKVKNFLVLIIIILLISSLLFLAYQKVSTIASQASSGSISRLQNISFKNTDLSIIFRLISFQSALNTAIANPIIGIGFPSEYYMEILGIRYSTNTIDNSYIRLAMGGGFLLLIFYIYLLIVLYKSSFQLIRRVHKGRDGVLALSLFSVIVLANLADCSETNISYVRVMPVIAFAWAGLVKLRETIYDTAYRH